MNSLKDYTQNLNSVIGYGTFITKRHWVNQQNVEVCIVKDYIRILPEGNWFPYALPLRGASFRALRFYVDTDRLRELDDYEGISVNLFKRIEIEVNIINRDSSKAFIYIPTKETIKKMELSPDIDKTDRWKEEIRKFPEITTKFPELLL